MKVSAHWLKDFVAISPPLERIAERLTLAGLEVKKAEPVLGGKDTVFEIEITTNRPDWLSHYGVAREIAVVENLSLKPMTLKETKKMSRPLPSGWKLSLKESEGCPFYTGVYLGGLSQAATPDFIKDRLAACGVRSISFVVDVTNYILLETGQPLHAFDADLLAGQEIAVRRAREGEKFISISGDELTLSSHDLLIADRERGVALAGVMGGKNTEVSERTRNIFLESAFFNPRWIRQTSLRHMLRSESSYRFERRVDPGMVELARERAIELIQQYAKPRFTSGVLRAGQTPPAATARIHLSSGEVAKVLGIQIKPNQIFSILTRLGLEVKSDSKQGWNVKIPSFRSDLARPVDLIEEVARIYGYENIPETLPPILPKDVGGNEMERFVSRTRSFFADQGFYETGTFSLVSTQGLEEAQDLIHIVNPQNKELATMRPTLLPSLLGVVERNVRYGIKNMGLFEIANIYRKRGPQEAEEEKVLGVALFGSRRDKNWLDAERPFTYHDLKGIVEEYLGIFGIEAAKMESRPWPYFDEEISESLVIEGEGAGYLGRVHVRKVQAWDLEGPVYFAELFLRRILPQVHWIQRFREIPKFPSIERDLSITVAEEVKAGEVSRAILAEASSLAAKVELFDFFRGGRIPKGFKNFAFRITYQSPEKTLVSEDIQDLHTTIAQKLQKKFQASFQVG